MADHRPSGNILRVLILDDSPDDTEQASAALRQAGYMLKTQRLETGVAVEQNLDGGQWDLILCAHGIANLPVRQVVELAARKQPLLPVIVLSRRIEDGEVRNLMQAGARDVIMKGQWGRLVPAVERELATAQERRAAREAREALRQLETRYRTMIEASVEAISYVQDGMHMDANGSYLKLLGYADLDSLKEMPLLNLIDKADQARFKQALRKPEGADKTQEFTMVAADGQRIAVEVALTPITIANQSCVQVVATDISKRKALETKLQSMHQRDPLTGLFNRAHFLGLLGESLKNPGGLLMGITINQLATLNQQLGHVACDRLLVQLGLQLREACGQCGIARISGGQFAVLLDAKNAAQGEAMARKIAGLVEGLTAGEGDRSFKPEVTLTSVKLSGQQKDRQALMDQIFKSEAPAAAPAAPVAPRAPEPAIAPPPAAAPRAAPVRDLREQLAQALAQNKMELTFQPIVNLHGEPRCFYEARYLLRTGDDRLLAPAQYLPSAEAAGLGSKIDRAVLMSTIDTLSKYRLEGRPGILFITLSASAVQDSALLAAIQMHMKATGLNAGDVILQLNEAAFADHLEAARAFAQKARATGVGFALDNFTGQTLSLEQMAELDLDYLAVNCGPDGLEDDALFTAIDAAHALDKLVIARNLDDAGLFTTLFSRGVHYVQGDYLQPATTGLDYSFEAEQTLASDEPLGPNWRAAG
jgi:PAS domain S-box-containing protein